MNLVPALRVSPAFRRWFRGSRVVDASGEPVVVFHATDAEENFDRFEHTEDIGYHFGSVPCANRRLRQMTGEEDGKYAPRARIIPVVLAQRNPLRLPDLFTWAPRAVANALVDAEVVTQEEADAAPVVDCDRVRAWLAAAGYDGVVYHNETEGGGGSFICFDAGQIKSAISNRGGFRGPSFCR